MWLTEGSPPWRGQVMLTVFLVITVVVCSLVRSQGGIHTVHKVSHTFTTSLRETVPSLFNI